MERFDFDLAFEVIEKAAPNTIKFYTYQVVAGHYIDYLIMEKQYKTAAEWCSKIELSEKTWEEKVYIFAKEGHLDVKKTNIYRVIYSSVKFRINTIRAILIFSIFW